MHIIRLRGPWEIVPLEIRAATPLRLMLPGNWRAPLGDYTGRVQFRRRFHRPTGLGDDSQVLLAATALPSQRLVLCNDELVAADENQERYDLTRHLASENLLVIELTLRGEEPVLGEVWLEISEPNAASHVDRKSASNVSNFSPPAV
jgi:hypothetical protein